MNYSSRVLVLERTTTQGDEGETVNSYAYAGLLAADVQPYSASETARKEFGLSTTTSGNKRMFSNLDGRLLIGNQIVFEGLHYVIRGLHRWDNHAETILEPVQ
jgi:hypothetical protein